MKKEIKVVLLVPVPSLGKAGELRTVSFSYAKNFLFPRRLALLAEPNVLKHLRAEKERLAHEVHLRDAEATARSQQLGATTLHLRLPANAKGVLYGGVHAEDICLATTEARIPGIKPNMVTIPSPIGRIGEHRVVIRFGRQKIEVRVQVSARS